MAALPYMQFQIAEYKADTEHLTTAEHGAYLLLIFNYWVTGKPLPDNDRRLAAITKCSADQWAAMRDTIADFFVVADGQWCHKRVERDLAKIRDKQAQASRAGKKGASARYGERYSDRNSYKEKEKEKDKDKEALNHSVQKPDVSDKSDTRSSADDHVPDLLGQAPETEQPIDPGEKYTAAFEAWWLVYPLKTGKRKAFLAYEAAFKRLGGQKAGSARVHQKLLAAARAFATVVKRKGTEPRYVCHAATWLSQSRWDDADTVKAMTVPRRDHAPVYEGPILPPAPKPRARANADS